MTACSAGRRALADRRVRYVLAGAFASAVYYGVFAGIWLWASTWVPYLLVAMIANLVTAVAVYPVQRILVFRAGGRWLPGFLRFYLLSLWMMVFVLGGLPLLVEVGHVDVLVAQAVILVAAPIINYSASRVWVFRNR